MIDSAEKISDIAEKIKSNEDKRMRLGKFLREIKNDVSLVSEDIPEEKLVYPVKKNEMDNIRVSAVDGGLSQHSYHGIDLILTRAVGVVFDYKRGTLDKVAYFPDSIVFPKLVIISDPYSENEIIVSSSLERQKEELRVSVELLKEFSPDVHFLDGSIVPHGNDRPRKNSPNIERYKDVINYFKKLYSFGSIVGGVVEDSRGRRFCDIVSERILPRVNDSRVEELQKILAGTRDTNLLYHILKKGERTCVFRYSKDPSKHQVLSDLGEFSKHIYSFYVKTAEFDRPVRVDFFASTKPLRVANFLASVVLATSCNNAYGCPAPIIEADFRAKLKEEDADYLHSRLVETIGMTPSLMKLRREQRPF